MPSEAPEVPTVSESPDLPTPIRSEPVEVVLPGWVRTEGTASEPSERILRFSEGTATVELVRWWGQPETDGGPMEVAETRHVQIDGVATKLLRTSVFQGRSVEADVVFLRDDDWIVRVSCVGCTPEQLDAVLQGLSVEPAQPPALHDVPALPAHTVLQVFCRDTGHLERFMDDGRWLVREPSGDLAPRAPRSTHEPDRDVLSDDALRRIREKLDEVGFFELPDRVEGTMPGPGVLLTGGQGVPQAQVYVFSAFDGSGAQHSVELEGEIRAFGTFGALQPVMESLDREAWGRWMLE